MKSKKKKIEDNKSRIINVQDIEDDDILEGDMVNNPSHYQSMSSYANIDCITAMRAAFGDYEVSIWCKLNAFKYNWRCDDKGGNQDVEKAI